MILKARQFDQLFPKFLKSILWVVVSNREGGVKSNTTKEMGIWNFEDYPNSLECHIGCQY